jgi:serine acetyltransferase
VYIPHGNVMLSGVTLIGRNAVLCPWIGLGCKQGSLMGPYLRDGVFVGTHVTVIGDLEIGERAVLGAGALVTGDVPAFARVAGAPAKPIAPAAGAEPAEAGVAS